LRIGIIGTGRVGGTLGRRWAEKGHRIAFGSRDPQAEKVRKLVADAGATARAMTAREACAGSDVIVYAAPWPVAESILQEMGSLAGKILVDCTNPLTSDFAGLEVGHTTSAAERIAAWSNGARVVKAFNNVSSAIMANPVFGDLRATMFYCGDDRDAKGTVRDLAAELGFDPVDAGALKIARYLEPFAMLYIQLAVKAFKIMKR
jgi:NADPH-dependent F420 reductase